MEIGVSLAIANGMVWLVVAIVGVLSRFYRIQTEEAMLKMAFGEE